MIFAVDSYEVISKNDEERLVKYRPEYEYYIIFGLFQSIFFVKSSECLIRRKVIFLNRKEG
jgi:hypothetical protein